MDFPNYIEKIIRISQRLWSFSVTNIVSSRNHQQLYTLLSVITMTQYWVLLPIKKKTDIHSHYVKVPSFGVILNFAS